MCQQSARRGRLGIIAFLVAGLIGLLAYVRLYDSAFPCASLDLKITRSDATRISRKFLAAQGHDLKGYQSTVNFGYNSYAKQYLERNLGLREANRLMGGKVKVWYWHVRWFRPEQEEEFSTNISTTGELVSFEHTIPEKTRGKSLTASEARQVATGFLGTQGIDPSRYTLEDKSSSKLPNRVDHDFQWEEAGFLAAKGKNRVYVSVAGDRVSSFGYRLKIPEDWDRKTSGESGQGQLLMTIAGVFSTILGFAAMIVFLFGIRARAVRWRFILLLVGIFAVIRVLGTLNSIPLMRSFYSTTEPMTSFWISNGTSVVSGLVMLAIGIFVLAASADVMQTWAFPGRPRISGLLSVRGILSGDFAHASLVGFGLGLAQLGYVAVFYVVTTKYLHAWSPANVPYRDTLSTALPWIYPLTIGISAAVNEEFTFRVLAISLIKRYAKLTWLAVVLPAMVWAFLHSNYPQLPPYIRGIELTVVGLVMGLVYLRYGVVATLVAHYTYNSVVSGTILLRSDNLYFRVSGLLVVVLMLIPLIPTALSWLRKVPHREDWQEPEPAPEVPRPAPVTAQQDEVAPRVYVPLERRGIKALVLSSLIAAAVCGILFHEQIADAGRSVKCINRKTATRLAQKYLHDRGINTEGFMVCTEFYDDSGGTAEDYVLTRMDAEKAQERFDRELHDAGWCTYWFKPLTVESYQVWLDPDGRLYSWDHDVKESAPGSNLSPTEAKAAAEKWLKSLGVDMSLYRMVDSSASELDHRTDHSFTWERKERKIAGASFRLEAYVQGNEVLSRSDFIDIPEEHYRELEKTTTRMTICQAVLGLLTLVMTVFVLVVFILHFVNKRINWRQAFPWGGLTAAGSLIVTVNNLPGFFSDYSDTDPLARFVVISIVTTLLGTVGILMSTACSVGLTDALYRRAFPDKPALADWFHCRSGERWRIRALKDGMIMAVTSLPFIALGVGGFDEIQQRWFPSLMTASGPTYSDYLDGLSPIVPVLALVAGLAFFTPLSVAWVVSLARLYIKRTWLMALVLVTVFGLGTGADTRTWPELWAAVVGAVITAPLAYVLLRYWFGHNAYAYAFLFYFCGLQAEGLTLTGSRDLALCVNGYVLIVLAWIPVVWVLSIWFRDRRRRTQDAEADDLSQTADQPIRETTEETGLTMSG